jgi:hypothetical protein
MHDASQNLRTFACSAQAALQPGVCACCTCDAASGQGMTTSTATSPGPGKKVVLMSPRRRVPEFEPNSSYLNAAVQVQPVRPPMRRSASTTRLCRLHHFLENALQLGECTMSSPRTRWEQVLQTGSLWQEAVQPQGADVLRFGTQHLGSGGGVRTGRIRAMPTKARMQQSGSELFPRGS